MWIPGLVSISFRNESPKTIIDASKAAGLQAIEWGGDVHVPVGDLGTARQVGMATREAGLAVAAYGSYYRLGTAASPAAAFAPVLDTAQSLGAATIRIWAGTSGSAEASQAARDAWAAEARLLAGMADKAGVTLTLECHNGTLTDRWESALAFLRQVNHPHLRMYWQPNQFEDSAYNQRAAQELAPYTQHVHVFQWDAQRRYPLVQGREEWRIYLDILTRAWKGDGRKHGLLLEFMHDDRLASLPETADELLKWQSTW